MTKQIRERWPKDKLSHTKKSLFNRCGKQFYFRYVRGIKLRPAAGMKVGIWGHDTVAHNFRHQMEHGEQLSVKDFCGHWEAQLDEGAKQEDLAWEGVSPGEYRDRFLGTAHRPGLMPQLRTEFTPLREPHKVEEEFSITIPGDPNVTVGGFVDFFGKMHDRPSGNLYVPVDGKFEKSIDVDPHGTDEVPLAVSDFKFKKSAARANEVMVDDQLTLYSLAMEAKRCIVECVTLDVFVHGLKTKNRLDTYQMRRTESDHRRILQEYLELGHRIALYGDNPEAYPFCEIERTPWPCSEQWCGFRKMCPRGGGDYSER